MEKSKTQERSWSEAEAERQERQEMERLMVSLTIAVSSIVLSLVLFIGGLTFFGVSAIFGPPNWAGLIVAMIGMSMIIGLFIWSSLGRKNNDH